jgi:hypothetical protein
MLRLTLKHYLGSLRGVYGLNWQLRVQVLLLKFLLKKQQDVQRLKLKMLVFKHKELIGLNTQLNYLITMVLVLLLLKLQNMFNKAFSPDTVTLKLQETPEYKQRFAGNEITQKSRIVCSFT